MLELLNEDEIELVSGGTIVVTGDDDYWAEELLRYKTGQPNRFGENL